ncbi:MAG: PEP-CTERM sorting domain-containing protein [Alphaproteobacteria bacterium]|jgi:hypothetical protein|nr:PEP-CTERM sorting domain-containing protein [Alphaproteobacteria bacterium]
MRGFKTFLAAGALSLIAGSALAAPITGKIGFGGSASPVDVNGDPLLDFNGAVGIDVENDLAQVLLGSTDGSFSAVPAGTLVTFNDFTFDPAVVPVAPLWSLTAGPTTFSFDLESITVLPSSDDNFINLAGSGTLMGTGFDDTEATWSFSGNTTTNDTEFVFSADNTVTQAPEPATLLLIGTGLLAAGGIAMRRRGATGARRF